MLPKRCRISLVIDQYHYELCMVYAARFVYLELMLIDFRILKDMVHVTVYYMC